MRHFIQLVCLLALMLPGPGRALAQAQWSAAFQVGADRFWGGSLDNTPEHRSFRPYRPTTFAAALQRRGPRIGLGLRVGYSQAPLALEGESAVVAAKEGFTVYSLTPTVSYTFATIGSGNSLFLAAGPFLELWDIVDLDNRTRIGGQSSIGLTVPLGWKLAANISGSLAVISSPFAQGELPPEYNLRALWRRSIAGGLEYRF